METTLSLASLTVCVRHDFPALASLFSGFLAPPSPRPDIELALTDAAMASEQARIGEDRGVTRQTLASLALCRAFCDAALPFDVLYFHGSCISYRGGAYLFAAPSGTGKSTHTAFWRQCLGSDAVMINDDKPLLRRQEGVWEAWGSPWMGKHRLGCPMHAPLRGICMLNRGENRISPLTPIGAMPKLFLQSYRPESAEGMQMQFDLLTHLAAHVPMYTMECTPDRAAAEMAIQTMTGGLL